MCVSLARRRVTRLDPRLHVRPPADVRLVEEDAAGARGGRRRGVAQVRDLEQQLHRLRERDALVGREREDAVVVHHRVHRLDPLGVDVAVEDHPLGHLRLGRELVEVAHDLGDHAVVRLLGDRVHVAVQLVRRHRLRVEGVVHGPAAALLQVRLRGREGLPQL
eukprot:3617100-Prymnesium_polylepis.1